MTVYVDDARIPAKAGRYNSRWSHMMADSMEELIEFAESIGLRKSWLQNKRSGVHFDVTDGKRMQALANGAVEVPCRTKEWMRVVKLSMTQYTGTAKLGERE